MRISTHRRSATAKRSWDNNRWSSVKDAGTRVRRKRGRGNRRTISRGRGRHTRSWSRSPHGRGRGRSWPRRAIARLCCPVTGYRTAGGSHLRTYARSAVRPRTRWLPRRRHMIGEEKNVLRKTTCAAGGGRGRKRET